MTNSLDSLGTSQSLVSFSDAIEDKSDAPALPKEITDREGYNAGMEDSDEEQRTRDVGGIDIPIVVNNSNNLSTSAAKRYEGTQNYRKTLRLSSEQIVSGQRIVKLKKSNVWLVYLR